MINVKRKFISHIQGIWCIKDYFLDWLLVLYASRHLPKNKELGLRQVIIARKKAEQMSPHPLKRIDLVQFMLDFINYKERSINNSAAVPTFEDIYPCLCDKTKTVSFDAHYIYHTAWAIRVLAETQPTLHHDVGSHLMFSTLCSAFIPIEHYDYRSVEIELEGLSVGHMDLLALSWGNDSINSLSCMHVVEHIGLGRYGDKINPAGDKKAMSELARVLAPGGQLLFVVPVGQPHIQFNAHRIYSYAHVLEGLSDLDLVEFSLISMLGTPRFIRFADPGLVKNEKYGCGCFLFSKPS